MHFDYRNVNYVISIKYIDFNDFIEKIFLNHHFTEKYQISKLCYYYQIFADRAAEGLKLTINETCTVLQKIQSAF